LRMSRNSFPAALESNDSSGWHVLNFGADIWREELIQELMRPGDGDAPILVSWFGLSVNENIKKSRAGVEDNH
jgi:hypothetical protein